MSLLDIATQLSGCSMKSPDKFCGRCEQRKPHSEFAVSNRYDGGLKLQRWCKQCHREVNRNWYKQQNSERRVRDES